MIAGKDDQGVVVLAAVFQIAKDPADVEVDLGDQAVVGGGQFANLGLAQRLVRRLMAGVGADRLLAGQQMGKLGVLLRLLFDASGPAWRRDI